MKFLPLFFAVTTAGLAKVSLWKYAKYNMSPTGNPTLKMLGCSGTVEIHEYRGKSTINWDFKNCGEPGKRGFHVHSVPDFSRGCASTGGHFNPEGVDHASVHSTHHHVGDLPEIEIDAFGNSKGTFEFPTFARLFDYGVHKLPLVLHGGKDDLGEGGQACSKKSGCAGPRVACGVAEEVLEAGF